MCKLCLIALCLQLTAGNISMMLQITDDFGVYMVSKVIMHYGVISGVICISYKVEYFKKEELDKFYQGHSLILSDLCNAINK